jgi:acyl-CoA thioesterase FadM
MNDPSIFAPVAYAFPFARRRRIHWGDSDPAGLVFAPRCIEFAIAHVEDLFLALFGVGFHAWQEDERIILPWVHVECEFLSPVRPADDVVLTLSAPRVGRSSIAYVVEGRGDDGKARFRVAMTAVAVGKETGRPVPVPEDLRAALEPVAPDTDREAAHAHG